MDRDRALELARRYAAPTALVLALVFAAFAFGVSTGVNQHYPYDLLVEVKETFAPAGDASTVLDQAFVGPLPGGALEHPAVASSEDLDARLDDLRIVTAADFLADAPRTDHAADIHDGVLRLDFRVANQMARAYAYVVPGPTDCGALLIPGSGDHQSTAIVAGHGYHGPIADTLSAACDTFVLIKPNQDLRTIHRDGRALGPNHLYPHLLNTGHAYAATYLVEAMAVQDWLETQYATTGVVGLSQGGYASLLVSLRTEPDFVVVASGYTVLVEDGVYPAGRDQIIIPGMADTFPVDAVRDHLAATDAHYLFSYGRQETGVYGVEAEDGTTCDLLRPTQCVVHDGGHGFPTTALTAFLAEHA